MEKIEALIFDMDGLIFDSERIVQRSWNIAGEALGYGPVGEQIYYTLGFNVKRREQHFKSVYGPDFDMEAFGELTKKAFYEIVEEEGLPLKTGVKELISLARSKGIKIALATSSRREYAHLVLNREGLLEQFDGCVFGDMVTRAKPDPEIYQKAAETVGVHPKNCLALEDAPAGIRSATSAGMRCIMVPDLVQPDEEIQKLYTKKVDTLLEVMDLI